MRHWREALPLCISVGLIVWLATRISMDELLDDAALLPWQVLAPMTAAMVACLYFLDTLCLQFVFTDGAPLTYREMLHARGKSYLISAVNQMLGQAALAWNVARIRRSSFIAALSRCILLSWHEGVILSVAALAGSWWINNSSAVRARAISAVLLALLVTVAMFFRCLPIERRRRWQQTRWGAWLGQWSWRQSARLFLLRTAYFAFIGCYAVAALSVCGQGIGLATALTVIPMVLIATNLPSMSGLGTRETALYVFLPSDRPHVLLAVGLIWSTGMIVVRLCIGLAWLWLGRNMPEPAIPDESRVDSMCGIESM